MSYSSDVDDQPLVFRKLKLGKMKRSSQPPKPSKDLDSEDDKPLSTKISTVLKGDTNHVQKGLETGPSLLPEPQVKYEDSDDEKPLSSKFRNNSNVRSSITKYINEKNPGTSGPLSPKLQVDDEDSDDDERLTSKLPNKSSVGSSLTKKVYQNGSASRENQSRNLVSNKRPPDDKRTSVQSSVKKSKFSDPSTPANRKPVPLKAKIKSDVDEDDEEDDESDDDSEDDDDYEDDDEVHISQRIKKQAPSSSKSSSLQQKEVKKNSTSVKQTNKMAPPVLQKIPAVRDSELEPHPVEVTKEAGSSQRPAKRTKKKIVPSSAVSLMMRAEKCRWLLWPEESDDRKVELNSRLARYQNQRICAPRVMEWPVLTKLGVLDQIEDMLRVQITTSDGLFETRAWKEVLSVKQQVYREMCLEFFCSLVVEDGWVDSEVMTREVIHFRLGGVQHHCTLPQFGVYTGIFLHDEVDRPGFSEYLIRGDTAADATDGFEADVYWREITGLGGKFSTQSKAVLIRDPILRVVHKLLVYSFFHRSTHHDKIYLQELWALWLFQHRQEGRFMNLPWVLACHLEVYGAGNRTDAQMCGGHFVTLIMKSLGLFTPDTVAECSAPLPMQVIDLSDFRASKLIDKDTGRLIGVMEVPPPQGAPVQVPRPRVDLRSIAATLDKVQATQQVLLSKMGVILYAFQRYQPMMERLAQQDASTARVELSAYAPPDVIVPDAEQGEDAVDQDVGADDESSESDD